MKNSWSLIFCFFLFNVNFVFSPGSNHEVDEALSEISKINVEKIVEQMHSELPEDLKKTFEDRLNLLVTKDQSFFKYIRYTEVLNQERIKNLGIFYENLEKQRSNKLANIEKELNAYNYNKNFIYSQSKLFQNQQFQNQESTEKKMRVNYFKINNFKINNLQKKK